MRQMRRALPIATLFLLVALAAPQRAPAQTGYWVTIAARVCDAYTDIHANKARNNIQESLKDLGPDTPYTGIYAAANVNPRLESCRRRTSAAH
jgi:hypothetical protein